MYNDTSSTTMPAIDFAPETLLEMAAIDLKKAFIEGVIVKISRKNILDHQHDSAVPQIWDGQYSQELGCSSLKADWEVKNDTENSDERTYFIGFPK